MAKKKTISKKRKPDPADNLSFEQALEQLEALIDRVEHGEIGIEDAIAQYERGSALVKRCRSILDRAETRIAELTADGDLTPGGGGGDE